jgi:hypothetical protein
VDEWYHKGPITEDIMRGIFEYKYRAKWEPPTTRKKIDDHGFTIHKEKTQRPMGVVKVKQGDKGRKLVISANTKKATKDKKEKETREAKEEKIRAKEDKLKVQAQAKEIQAKMRNRSTRPGAKRKTTATLSTPKARKKAKRDQRDDSSRGDNTQEPNSTTKRTRESESQEVQEPPFSKNYKPPLEPTKTARAVGTGLEQKEKEKKKKKGKAWDPPQANTTLPPSKQTPR